MMERVEVVLSDVARDAVLAIRSRGVLAKIRKRLETLAFAPEMGVTYDPICDSARPDHEVLVTYVSNYGIYYVYDEEARRVEIEYVCDERCDPRLRFSEPWGTVDDIR